ncbi:hypothetical protein HK405_002332, partial [Cladochytrium tenue]
MIIDEGHRMKNSNSRLSTTLMQFYQSRYRLILTGTPLQIFNSVKSFDEWFSSPFATSATVGQAAVELNEEERLLMIKGLHKVLRPFLLRRLKRDVESELPDKVETVIKKLGGGSRALNNLVMQFRKICNHPFIFPEVEELMNPMGNLVDDLIFRCSGKFELLDRILPKFLRTGHRVLMFFQMTQIMDIIEDYFRYRGIRFLRLDGHVKGEDRTRMLTDFNAPDS